MSAEMEITVSAALSTLAGRGAIKVPGEVTESYERGYREQCIDGEPAACNHDDGFWERTVELEVESFVRGAQRLANNIAIRDYFRTAPSEPPAPEAEQAARLAERIFTAVDSSGVSLADLSSFTGLTSAAIGDILSGTRAPKIPELLAISQATGDPVGQLLGTNAASRVLASASGSEVDQLREALAGFVDIKAHLDEQAIPEA